MKDKRLVTYRQLTFHFFNTTGECHFPLGLENGMLTDGQISASSYLDDQHLPYFARLRNDSYWQPEANDTSPWIQVTFSSQVVISVLVIQGAGVIDGGWVNQISVSYSDDGEHWNIYNHVILNTDVSLLFLYIIFLFQIAVY